MMVAIDYDGTFAEDPELFTEFVKMLRARGHDAVCVTGRNSQHPSSSAVAEHVKKAGLNIVFADRGFKRQVALDLGYKIDVWIDDFPEFIGPQTLESAMAAEKSGTIQSSKLAGIPLPSVIEMEGRALLRVAQKWANFPEIVQQAKDRYESMSSDPLLCDHANEVSRTCHCPPVCYCRQPANTCGDRVIEHV